MRRLVLAAALLPTVALAQSAGTLVDPRTVPNAPLIGATQINQAMTAKVDVNGGATGATMSPAGPGSIARTLASHFADRFNVKDYGAVGNGTADDSAAFQAAINAALATGENAHVVIPSSGAFLVNANLAAVLSGGQSLTFSSDTPGAHGATILVGAAVTTALTVILSSTSGSLNAFSSIGVDFYHTVSGTSQTAVSVITTTNAGAQFPALDVSRLVFGATAGSFATGLSMMDVNVTDVDHITCDSGFAGTCIKYDSNGPLAVEHHLSDIYVNGPAVDAVAIGHTGMTYSVQGFTIDRLSCTGTIDCVDAYGAANAIDELVIKGSQINTTSIGINVQSANTVVVNGNYFLGNPLAVNDVGGSRFVFTGNTCYEGATNSVANKCIVLNGTGTGPAGGETVSGNLFTNLYGVPILLESSTNYAEVNGNTCLGNTCVVDQTTGGTTNSVGPNYEGSSAGNMEYQDSLLDVASGFLMGNGAPAALLYGDGVGNVIVTPHGSGPSANLLVPNGSVGTPTVLVGPKNAPFPLQITADGAGNGKLLTTLTNGAGIIEVGPNVKLDGSTVAGPFSSSGLRVSTALVNGGGVTVNIPDMQIGPGAGLDQFTGPDSFTIGGTALPDTPAGWTSSAPAFNPTVNMITAPYGAFNAGCGLCLFMSQDNITANRAGISGVDYRTGASAMPAIGSNDAVGFYEQPQNYPAKFVLQAASYTPTEVVLKTPLTAEQISLLRTNMYLVTNSIDPTSPTGTASDGLPVNNLMEGFISGWDPAGTYITVAGWASVSGTGVSNAVPSTTALDTAYSTYSNPTVFIGAPTKVWGRNTYINYQTAGSNPTTSLIRRFEGEEMDWRYNASKANEVDFHGLTMSFAPTGGVGPAGMTSDSYALLMNGVLPRYVVIQDSGAVPVLIDTGFYQMGSNGESTTTPNAEMFEHDAYADGANELRLEGRVIHTGTATGWPGAEMDLGLWIDGGQGTSGGTYAGGLKFNANGTAQASVSLCGQSGCAIQAQANGLPKIVNVTYSQLPACAANLEGTVAEVTDATVATFNAAITAGGGSNHMMGRCNGTAWVVD